MGLTSTVFIYNRKDQTLVRSIEKEQEIFEQYLDEITLSDAFYARLRRDLDRINRADAEKLLDYIYYSFRTNRVVNIRILLYKLKTSETLTQEINGFLKILESAEFS